MANIAHLRGRVAGAAILTLFGSAWCIIALHFWEARPGWSLPAAFMATIALLGLCVWRLAALRGKGRADNPAAAAKGKRTGMLFGIIFGAECALIAICTMLLGHFGLGIWIPIAVAMIVGLHFIPLAKVFEVPLYYWTGTLSVLGMIACSLISDSGRRLLCAGLVMAAVLWVTAVLLVFQRSPALAERS